MTYEECEEQIWKEIKEGQPKFWTPSLTDFATWRENSAKLYATECCKEKDLEIERLKQELNKLNSVFTLTSESSKRYISEVNQLMNGVRELNDYIYQQFKRNE